MSRRKIQHLRAITRLHIGEPPRRIVTAIMFGERITSLFPERGKRTKQKIARLDAALSHTK